MMMMMVQRGQWPSAAQRPGVTAFLHYCRPDVQGSAASRLSDSPAQRNASDIQSRQESPRQLHRHIQAYCGKPAALTLQGTTTNPPPPSPQFSGRSIHLSTIYLSVRNRVHKLRMPETLQPVDTFSPLYLIRIRCIPCVDCCIFPNNLY